MNTLPYRKPTQLKCTRIAALVVAVAAAAPVRGDPQPPDPPKLESLRGTMITIISEDMTFPAKIWAKGNTTRLDVTQGQQTAISIQLGDTLYTYLQGSKEMGRKQHLGTGLASMGLIKQIEEVKAKGKKQGVEQIEGLRYHKYEYDVNAPGEMAVVYLSAETSLPRLWVSTIQTADKDTSLMQMFFRDLKANVPIPDSMFKLQAGVTFSEKPPTKKP